MADLSDVSAALVTLAAQALYPSGTSQASLAGIGVKVYAGWPLPQQLDADQRAASPIAHVSVWPRDEERNTTRYPPVWQHQTVNAATVTATLAGQAVTFAGAGATGQNIAVLANGLSFVYAVQANDTGTSIATALAALVAPSIPGTTSAGAVLTLPNSARVLAARVGVSATLIRELRRQERAFQLSVWADSPAHRDAVVQPLDVALAAVTFLALPDGTSARLRYRSSRVIDAQEKDRLYRRDLMYTVEYATTQTTPATQIVTEQIGITAQDSNQAQVAVAQVNL